MQFIRLTILLLLFSFLSNDLLSQTKIGDKFDLTGSPFDGYFDPITYSPDKKLIIIHKSDSYEVGHYYTLTGERVDGWIKYYQNKILYKKKLDSAKVKVKTKEVSALVIGIDSFFTISNFFYNNTLRKKPELAQYLSEINGTVFVKHYNFGKTKYSNPITETYLAKSPGDLTWENFSSTAHFKRKALKYFGNIPLLNKKITNGDYHKEDILTLIKTSEYNLKAENKSEIYYDAYWQEIRSKNQAIYHGSISKHNSTWTINYIKGNTPLYVCTYISFYPHKKNGIFTAFYPNGEIRKLVEFVDDRPKTVTIYNEKGATVKRKYQYDEESLKRNKTTDVITYTEVNDDMGNNLLDANNIAEQKIKDELSGNTFIQHFENKQLTKSTTKVGENEIYQITNPRYDFKIKTLQKKLELKAHKFNYDKAISVDAQGIILVKFIIDDKGKMISYSTLNKLHPQLDSIVESFMIEFTPEAKFEYKFNPYKENKDKKYCEVVIPFEFATIRFYRKPNNYYFFMNTYYWQYHFPTANSFMLPTTPIMMIPAGF